MLALTDDARHVIDDILDTTDSSGGVRISPTLDGGAPGQLQMTVVEAPAETDQVIDTGGGAVFVDAAAATFLDDKVLDANVDGESVQFELADQPQ
jgi:iron-sulfur cluster assembly protein